MNIPSIDRRTKENIIDDIAKLAQSYTPEWRFTLENPDVGSVLAIIFADMFEGTVKRYNNVLYKHHIAFLNNLDIGIKPAIPSTGIVCFEQAADFMNGVYVPPKTKLLASAEETGDNIIFETERGVFVTPARIKSMVYHSPCNDKILVLHDDNDNNENNEAITNKKMRLFDINEGENIQKHFIAICHGAVLNVSGDARLRLVFENRAGTSELESELARLADPERMKWVYYHDGEWKPFTNVKTEENSIVLEGKDINITEEEYGGHKGCWIGCEAVRMVGQAPINIGNIRLKTNRQNLYPEVIYVDDAEQSVDRFHPFGEELSLYRECYVACKEAFTKANAKITLSFDLDYTELEKEVLLPQKEIEWKLIMKRLPKEHIPEKVPVVCDRVIWEYWNGLGWARLAVDRDAETIFNHSRSGRINLSFQCPENIQPIIVNAYENYWIRMRLISSSNIYSAYCIHYAPVIKDIRLEYSYEEGRQPERVFLHDNTQVEDITASIIKGEGIHLFKPDNSKNTLYLGLNRYLEGSPVNIYFNIEGESTETPSLGWEYYSSSGKWKELKVTDKTNNFADPGIVTLVIPEDMASCEKFNREAYWIRAIDVNNEYNLLLTFPKVHGIYMNSVEVSNKETVEDEVFFVEDRQAGFSIQLSRGNILDLKVMVNEQGVDLNAYSEQYAEMVNKNEVTVTRDSYGNVSGLWVSWQEVDNFINSGPNDRHYVVDRISGQIQFGDGRRGMIPPKRTDEAIRVIYSVGGGRAGNVSAGRIDRMADVVRFIGKVYNPVATHGGSNYEDVETAVKRGANMLKHGNRAVTEEDFEALAMEASRSVAKVKCVSNITRDGLFKPGVVTVAVLLDEYDKGRSLFLSQKKNIQTFLEKRASSTIANEGINVIEPVFVRISTKVWISVKEMENIYEIQRIIKEKISEFIDPFKGNFNHCGWEIGELPNKSQIFSYIKSLDIECSIERLIVTASDWESSQFQETDIDELRPNPFYIAINGNHDISIQYE